MQFKTIKDLPPEDQFERVADALCFKYGGRLIIDSDEPIHKKVTFDVPDRNQADFIKELEKKLKQLDFRREEPV